MKRYSVNEIFCSLQGEGAFTGAAALFVRLAGCNLRCPFCDTDHTPSTLMTAAEIVARAEREAGPVRHLVITGGEPSLQLDAELTEAFKGWFIQVETNGTSPLPEGIDWVTCSPKEGGEVVHRRVDELKVVWTGPDCRPERYDSIEAKRRSLQPCDTGDPLLSAQLTAQAVDYVKAHPVWRLSLQTHKLISIP
nr:radical SAM protein [Bacteroides sp.]